MQRPLTEKLYDLRLQNYPEAFEISDRLRGELIFKDLWRAKSFELFVTRCLNGNERRVRLFIREINRCHKRLQDALKKWPRLDPNPTEKELKRIWEAKNHFRRCLRVDV